MTIRSRQPSPAAAFTLVEMLVATAVLVLLVIMVTELVNSTNGAITGSTRHISADDQARAVFDRMAKDFVNMPKRKDLDSSAFLKVPTVAGVSGSNDALFFYSEAPAYFDNAPATSAQSTMALVGYCINPSYQLMRLGKGLTWDGSPSASGGGIVFLPNTILGTTSWAGLTATGTIANPWGGVVTSGITSSPDADFHVIGDGVFRLEFCYQLKDGTFSSVPVMTSGSDTITNGQPTNATGNLIGFQDVSAIVVAIAVLDTNSRKLIGNSANIANLAGALVDSGTSAPAQAWESAMNSPTFYSGLTGIPVGSTQQVRIYQRFFYLGTQP